MHVHINGMFFKVKTYYEVSFAESFQELSENKLFAKYLGEKFYSYAWLKLLLRLSCTFCGQYEDFIIITKKTGGLVEFEKSFSQLIAPQRTSVKPNKFGLEELGF